MAVIVARATARIAYHFLETAGHLSTITTCKVLALIVSAISADLVVIAAVI